MDLDPQITGITQSLIGTIYTYTTGPGTPFIFFFHTVSCLVKGAYAGWCRSEISQIHCVNFTFPGKKLFTKFR